ncbi:hypothetical protein ACFYUY_02315 [Kitasatospora sp. NPDC004745]|uniref:hypothetical protein n=1 Tax=Kitasatospora sp. NPDC004745 TaxID=3364019 RepID=UPI00369AD3C9
MLERLGEEHRAVRRVREEPVALLAGIEVTDPERMRSEPDRMAELLEAHLDHEEHQEHQEAELPFPGPGTATRPAGA